MRTRQAATSSSADIERTWSAEKGWPYLTSTEPRREEGRGGEQRGQCAGVARRECKGALRLPLTATLSLYDALQEKVSQKAALDGGRCMPVADAKRGLRLKQAFWGIIS